MSDERNSLHWCVYCKDEIFDDEQYIVIGGTEKYYHLFCFKQENTFNDEDIYPTTEA